MSLSEKAAYIRGLAEGMELDTNKKENRIMQEMLELLCDIASTVEDNEEDTADLFDALNELDEDLASIEDEVYGAQDDCCGGHGHHHHDDEGAYEISCPKCDQLFIATEDELLSGDVVCPNCGEKIEIEIDGHDCDCGNDHSEEK